ncbi:MAG TPA: SRPBCC family protein [Actinomycetes bacterium]|nr:SRPBCC family protein [Actinomycetes bacterium]
MADRTESSITVDAAPADVMAVIADFEAYPEWTGAVKQAEVRAQASNGRAKEVWFDLDAGAIKDQYTLGYTWKADREVRWTLVEAENIVKSMDGAYLLEDNGDGSTTVTYQLAVDIKIPMLGMIKRKAEKVIIDTALKELKKRVEG